MAIFSPSKPHPVKDFFRKQVEVRADTSSSALPETPHELLKLLFPLYITAPFADHHQDFWDFVWSIDAGTSGAYVSIWPRGGAKSTSAELATITLGARKQRRYALYVSSTQDKADKHVQTLATILESKAIGEHFPALANRQVSKYGNSRGWRRDRLWTEQGFIVDAVGLDTGVRGLKIEEQRPDLIILDDIDELTDNQATTEKKIEMLTKTVLPAGGPDVVILAIQNKVIADGVFAQLADNRAEWMADRIVSGPIPAVVGLEYTEHVNADGRKSWTIDAGKPTWEGQGLATCQRQMNQWGPKAFLAEAQHEVEDRLGGALVFPNWDIPTLSKRPIVPWEECKFRVVSADPGGGDPTAMHRVGVDKDERRIQVYPGEFYERGGASVDDYAAYWHEKPGQRFVIGETGGTTIITSLRRMGIPAVKAELKPDENRAWIKWAIENGLLGIDPSCENLLTEGTLWRWKPAKDEWTGETFMTSVGGRRHHDGMDNLGYALAEIVRSLRAARPEVIARERQREAGVR